MIAMHERRAPGRAMEQAAQQCTRAAGGGHAAPLPRRVGGGGALARGSR